MGYNISEVTGATGGGTLGLDTWTFDVTLNGTGVTVVSGDFDEVPIGGGPSSEADQGYDFVIDSGSEFGSLSFNATTGEFTFTIDRSAVFDTGSDQTVVISVTGTDTDGSDTDTLNINLLICVARGTLIETKAGPKRVETLNPGDLIVTMDGPARPVRWIGSRKVLGPELRSDPSLRPIRIAKGALGHQLPKRELTVSPQHRILVADWRAEIFFGRDEVLVPAKALLNDTTIQVDRKTDHVEYFHILFDNHEIMYTEGLPTESFYPSSYALSEISEEARTEIGTLFPELASGDFVPETARTVLRRKEGLIFQHCHQTQTKIPDGRLVA